jgi:ABC-type transport system involved in multi-copper enzyme maturation permease subunit
VIPILLIAGNFLREQRWLVILLVILAASNAAIFSVGDRVVAAEDILFYVKQQTTFAILFSVFLATSAIHNERKTRRILAVLSKAIGRRDYLAGLLLGVISVPAIYCLAIALAGTWLARHSGALRELWALVGVSALAAVLAGAVTLFFTTLLNPLFATVAAALAMGVPIALERTLGHSWASVLPVYSLVMSVSGATLAATNVSWPLIGIAVGEVVLLWLASAVIFARRDITVAVE